MSSRRSFLGVGLAAILEARYAPAAVGSRILMPIRSIADSRLSSATGFTLMKDDVITLTFDGQVFHRTVMRDGCLVQSYTAAQPEAVGLGGRLVQSFTVAEATGLQRRSFKVHSSR